MDICGSEGGWRSCLRPDDERWKGSDQCIGYIVQTQLSGDQSRALLEKYSLDHFCFGVIEYLIIPVAIADCSGFDCDDFWLWFLVGLLIHFVSEFVENTPWVVVLLRQGDHDPTNEGDTGMNSFGDLLSGCAGYAIATAIGMVGRIDSSSCCADSSNVCFEVGLLPVSWDVFKSMLKMAGCNCCEKDPAKMQQTKSMGKVQVDLSVGCVEPA